MRAAAPFMLLPAVLEEPSRPLRQVKARPTSQDPRMSALRTRLTNDPRVGLSAASDTWRATRFGDWRISDELECRFGGPGDVPRLRAARHKRRLVKLASNAA